MEKHPECCPKFDPNYLNGKTHVWRDKLFYRNEIFQIMHIPFGIGKIITKMWSFVESQKAAPLAEHFLMLMHDSSPWKLEILMTVNKNIPRSTVKIDGTFYSQVFDGPYSSIPKWIKQIDKILKEDNKKAIDYYFYYPYCPKCAKKYGHNFVVIFAQTD